jgi:hypothetical protein
VVAHLADHPALVAALELTKIPHFTTVEKAAKRLLKSAPGVTGGRKGEQRVAEESLGTEPDHQQQFGKPSGEN